MANAKIVTGDCGENGNNCTYSLNTETGILTISGNGKMQDYSQQSYGKPYSYYYSTAPWTEKSITSIIIEEGVTYVGNYSFYGGYQSSPNGDKYPYSQIGKTLQTITIPNSVTSIGDDAFECCTSLTSVTIGNNLTSIGLRAFANCSSLISVTIPNSVTSIGEYAFSGCTGLTSVTISNSVTRIEYGTFQHCSGLTTITLPNSITSIGEYAFFGCSGLTSVKIPNSVTSMENYVFYRCSILNLVYCELGAPVSITNTVFQESSPTIYVPNCAFPAFSVAPVWKDMTIAPVSVNLAVVNNVGGVVNETCGSMEIEAIPYIGYHFKRWQDGNTDNPRSYTLSQSNRNFIAEFELDKHQITLTCNADQGSITGDQGLYNYGSEHTIEAVANYGYHFTQWNDGETENPRTFTLVKDTIFTAEFAPNQYTLSINYDKALGEVIAEQGKFDYLSQHTIQVNANYGYHLASWSDGVTDNSRILVLTKDTTITAIFAPNKYQLEIKTDDTKGSIQGDQGEFDYLSEHSIEAVANYGYHFIQWSDGVLDNPRNIILTKDTSITAVWEQCTAARINEDAVICAGESYHWMDGKRLIGTFDVPGTYFDTVRYTSYACDSIYFTLNLTVQYPLDTFTSAIICAGETFDWHGLTLMEPGRYYDTLRYATGCDSICFELNLTVQQASTIIIQHDAVTLDNAAEYGFDAVGNYSWNDTLHYSTGCDSIIRVHHLEVLPLPDYTISVMANNTKYGAVEGGGTFPKYTTITISATSNKGYQFNQWNDGNTDNPREITVTGDATYTAEFGVKMCSWLAESNDLEMGTIVTSYTNPEYSYGTQITVEASPNSGYKFVKWNDGKTHNPYKFSLVEDKYLLAIFMQEAETPEETEVQPSTTTATFTWPLIIGGYRYTLTVYVDVERINPLCNILFDQFGKFISRILFAPSRHSIQEEEAFTYTLTDLTQGTQYYYRMTAADEDGRLLNTDEGSFTTTNTATDAGLVESSAMHGGVTKFLLNGQLLILRDGKTYTVQGQEVR